MKWRWRVFCLAVPVLLAAVNRFLGSPLKRRHSLRSAKQALDFVDLSVYPVGGRVVYSIQKEDEDVLAQGVEITAQPVGATSLIRGLPSTGSLTATGTNYSVPLFAGRYLFLTHLEGRSLHIADNTAGYDSLTGLVTIERRARMFLP